jgi:hypothetical protein
MSKTQQSAARFLVALGCMLILVGFWNGARSMPPLGLMWLILGLFQEWSGRRVPAAGSQDDGGWYVRNQKRTKRLFECAVGGSVLGFLLSMFVSSVMTTVGAPPANPRDVVEADYQLFGVKLFQFKGPHAEAKIVWERINGIIGMVIVAACACAGRGLARIFLGKPEARPENPVDRSIGEPIGSR